MRLMKGFSFRPFDEDPSVEFHKYFFFWQLLSNITVKKSVRISGSLDKLNVTEPYSYG